MTPIKDNLNQLNPYSPPSTPTMLELNDDLSNGLIVGKNKSIFIPSGSRLPPRCIKCNAPVSIMMPKRLYQHSEKYILIAIVVFIACVMSIQFTQNLLLLESINFLPLILIGGAYFFRKKATVYVGVCDTHLKLNKTVRVIQIISTLSLLISLLVIVSNTVYSYTGVFLLLFVLTPLIIIISGLFITHVVRLSIKPDGVKIKGASKLFLRSIEGEFFKLR